MFGHVVESLREKQKEVARELILQAAADEVVEGGLEDLSLQAVATRAGVSKRTLYNYFDNRDTLLSTLRRWSDQLTLDMGGSLIPESLDSLPEVLQAVWRTWDAQGNILTASSMIDAATNESGISDSRRRRHSALADAVGEIRPDLDVEQQGELGHLFHAMASAPVYHRLANQAELGVEAAGELAGWATAVLRNALINGDDPYRKENKK